MFVVGRRQTDHVDKPLDEVASKSSHDVSALRLVLSCLVLSIHLLEPLQTRMCVAVIRAIAWPERLRRDAGGALCLRDLTALCMHPAQRECLGIACSGSTPEVAVLHGRTAPGAAGVAFSKDCSTRTARLEQQRPCRSDRRSRSKKAPCLPQPRQACARAHVPGGPWLVVRGLAARLQQLASGVVHDLVYVRGRSLDL